MNTEKLFGGLAFGMFTLSMLIYFVDRSIPWAVFSCGVSLVYWMVACREE